MSARAYVSDHLFGRGVRIHISPYEGALFDFRNMIVTTTTEATVEPDVQPLALDQGAARALYEALSRYFGGAPDMATIRKDYDAERARVDKFINHALGSNP